MDTPPLHRQPAPRHARPVPHGRRRHVGHRMQRQAPAQNSTYTAPGTYNFTVTATDGFLVHSATYALTVTAK